jgi:hypothetical protein
MIPRAWPRDKLALSSHVQEVHIPKAARNCDRWIVPNVDSDILDEPCYTLNILSQMYHKVMGVCNMPIICERIFSLELIASNCCCMHESN